MLALTSRRAVCRARVAQKRAVGRARRPESSKLTGEVVVEVEELLQANWSSRQIVALLPSLFRTASNCREPTYWPPSVRSRGELHR